MGTKNNPGKFDCYANAEPDEPMFVLLGRDKHAPILVYLWARFRQMDGEDAAKIDEALDCAKAMIGYLKGKGKEFVSPAIVELGFEEDRPLEKLMTEGE